MTEEQEESPEDHNPDLDSPPFGRDKLSSQELDSINENIKKYPNGIPVVRKDYSQQDELRAIKIFVSMSYMQPHPVTDEDRLFAFSWAAQRQRELNNTPQGKTASLRECIAFLAACHTKGWLEEGEMEPSKKNFYKRVAKQTGYSQREVERKIQSILQEVVEWGPPKDGVTESDDRINLRNFVKYFEKIKVTTGRKKGSINIRQN